MLLCSHIWLVTLSCFHRCVYVGMGTFGASREWTGTGPEGRTYLARETGADGKAFWQEGSHEGDLANWEPASCVTGSDFHLYVCAVLRRYSLQSKYRVFLEGVTFHQQHKGKIECRAGGLILQLGLNCFSFPMWTGIRLLRIPDVMH